MSENPEEDGVEAEASAACHSRYERFQKLAEDLRLSECMDSIVIIGTFHSNGWSQYTCGVAGNHFAAVGSAKRYVLGKEKEWEE